MPARISTVPASFFQVNPVQMKRLYDQVRAYVTAGMEQSATAEMEQSAGPVILDLYCGVGSIGLYCADIAEMVIGIESVESAVRDANRNAVINGIVRYICGKAEEVLPACVGASAESSSGAPKGKQKIDAEVKECIRRADIAILDPPRAGCRPELLEAVGKAGAESIVYVSCDPATLARDVQLLGEMGYQMLEATPVDMFPRCGHVETVVLMSRIKEK